MHHIIIIALLVFIIFLLLRDKKETTSACNECYQIQDPTLQGDCAIQNCTPYYDSYNPNMYM